MAKELIISANVHEKKVCVMEDGVVTEFYVERRDENQGVVGNLYKGRVMKVLPGMQSAFVDIGLDRDAFLYVSDFAEFMEDEDEIDFKEMGQPRQDDRSARGGRRRDERVQEAKKSATGKVKEEETFDEPAEIENMVEQLAEIADESLIPPPATDEEIEGEPRELKSDEDDEAEIEEAEVTPVEAEAEETPEEEAKAKKTTKGRTRPTKTAKAKEGTEEKPKQTRSRKKAAEEGKETEKPKTTRRTRKKKEDTDEEAAARKTTTAKRKTAAKKPATKRASRKRGAKASAEKDEKEKEGNPEPESKFERVTDDDMMEEAGDMLKDARVEEKIMDQIHETEYKTSPPDLEPEPEWRVGSFLSTINQESSFQRVVDETNETSSREETSSYAASEDADEADEIETSPFRHISNAIPEDILNLAMAESSDEMGEEADEEDDEAEVRSHRGRAEFAVRRGGRRRRPRRDTKSEGGDENGGEKSAPDATAEEKSAADADSKKAEAQKEDPKKAEAQKPSSSSRSRPPRRQDSRHSRRPDNRSRPEQSQGRKPDRGGTTISDLLREGQEILVQIAKEPIAKKGARITSHIALPGRYLVYMPTVNHVGVSRKINSEGERIRLKKLVTMLRDREGATGGFIARTACSGHSEQELADDMRYLLRTWSDLRQKADKNKAPTLVHRDLDLVQRIMRDQLSEEFTAIRIDSEIEYARIVEFVNRIQPKLVKRVKLYTGAQPILERYGVQPEIDKAVKSRVWLKSGGYIVINQTEALVAIDVNTGKFVGKSDKLEDTITRTNMEAAKEIVRQVRLRDLGGIIVIDFIDMDERKNRQRVMTALQQELQNDRAPSKILSINDFGLVAITRKRVKQSLERTLCTPCPYCQGGGMVKSAQTMCFEILEQAKAITKEVSGSSDIMLRVSPDVAEAFRTSEKAVLEEIEAYFGMPVTIESDPNLHQEQYDFAIV